MKQPEPISISNGKLEIIRNSGEKFLMRKMIRTNKMIDVRAPLINYYSLENSFENKKNREY